MNAPPLSIFGHNFILQIVLHPHVEYRAKMRYNRNFLRSRKRTNTKTLEFRNTEISKTRKLQKYRKFRLTQLYPLMVLASSCFPHPLDFAQSLTPHHALATAFSTAECPPILPTPPQYSALPHSYVMAMRLPTAKAKAKGVTEPYCTKLLHLNHPY